MRETRNIYRIFVGKSLGKLPLGRPRKTWEADRPGLGLCPLAGFGISNVEVSSSGTSVLIIL
jgi:hypothetical protein